jgi:hypothetical protein
LAQHATAAGAALDLLPREAAPVGLPLLAAPRSTLLWAWAILTKEIERRVMMRRNAGLN